MDESPLARARLHVQRGVVIVAQQETLVESLRRQGLDTAIAERLLATFRQSLAAMREDLARAERLSAMPTADPPVLLWQFHCSGGLTWTYRTVAAGQASHLSEHFPS